MLRIIIAIAVALVIPTTASAQLITKSKSHHSAPKVFKLQTKNLNHAKYVCNNGKRTTKNWHCNATRWLDRERDQTLAKLRPVSVYDIAYAQARRLGISSGEWHGCAVPLISRENAASPADWSPTRSNYEGSGAYGLGQALPASKMAPWGSDYLTSAATQIRWLNAYVTRYGGWCAANNFQLANDWY